MDGLGQDVVDAGFQKFDGLLQRAEVGEGDDRRAGLLADHARAFRPLLEIAEEEALDRFKVAAGGRPEPA